MKHLLFTVFVLLPLAIKAQTPYFYVGSATDKTTEPISLCSLDLSDGKLTKVQSFAGTKSSSYVCLSPAEDFLYAINGGLAVSAFKIDGDTKHLSFINSQPVDGEGACHLSVTPNNKFLMVANYSSGNVVVLPILADGSLNLVTSMMQHLGSGPNKERQEGPHAHYIKTSPDGNYAFAVDLGIDKVMNYALNPSTGQLSENTNQAFLQLASGAGPRHMIFHQNEKYAYVLNELNSSVTACTYDAQKGMLSIINTYPMLPDDFNEFSKAAAVRIHPSGKFLYASNRGHDSMAVFKIKKNGQLKRIQIIQDDIEWPRDFNLDPSGKYMLVANRNKNEITVFLIGKNGKLGSTGHTLEIAQPTSVAFFLN